MDAEIVFLFITFCGLAGILLRRNLLNIIVSFAQIILGLTSLIGLKTIALGKESLDLYFILFLVFSLIIFTYAIAILIIRRRSTLEVNELTELRG